MSWFNWVKGCKPTEKVDYKSKLEHKILHARQTPEPVFDLSDCNLKEVPSGVYSWCKVCLKEALLLNDNRLTNIDGGGNLKDLLHLRSLDLHNNQLGRLPDGIGKLENLRVLHLNNNSLKVLPKSFEQLHNLITLNISGNKISIFPEVLCNLRVIRTLDISCNNITKLPAKLTNLQTLDTLILTENNIKHPPTEICAEGLEAIMKFLCAESNVEYVSPNAAALKDQSKKTDPERPKNELVQSLDDYWKNLEKKKEQKRKEHLEMERLLQEQQESQASVVAELQSKRIALLNDVSKGQSKLEEELLQAQKKKDDDRQKLISHLVAVEKHSNKVIEELLTLAENSQSIESLLEAEKRERKEFEELFLKQRAAADDLRRKEVLHAMTQILQDEQLLKLHDVHKQELTKRLQDDDIEINASIANALAQKNNEQNETVANLLSEEQFQKEALIALMKAKDSDSLRIRDQIYLIQDELSKLTMLELKQKDLKIEFELNLLKQKREILTGLLLQLMEKQKSRQEEMKRRLTEMEQQRQMHEQDYWLIQYQRLMDHKPASLIEMESNMEPSVRDLLLEANAQDYIPLFAKQNISYVWLCKADAEQLREIGVHNPAAVLAILAARRARNKLQVPTAPERNEEEPSSEPVTPISLNAPSEISVDEITAHREVECVICMEKQCSILYLPCGHVCCCENCTLQVTDCPLCRGSISQKILLRFSE